jgi:hypothetical protein
MKLDRRGLILLVILTLAWGMNWPIMKLARALSGHGFPAAVHGRRAGGAGPGADRPRRLLRVPRAAWARW